MAFEKKRFLMNKHQADRREVSEGLTTEVGGKAP